MKEFLRGTSPGSLSVSRGIRRESRPASLLCRTTAPKKSFAVMHQSFFAESAPPDIASFFSPRLFVVGQSPVVSVSPETQFHCRRITTARFRAKNPVNERYANGFENIKNTDRTRNNVSLGKILTLHGERGGCGGWVARMFKLPITGAVFVSRRLPIAFCFTERSLPRNAQTTFMRDW